MTVGHISSLDAQRDATVRGMAAVVSLDVRSAVDKTVTRPLPLTIPWTVRFDWRLRTLIDVALGARLERLAARREQDAGHLEDQRDVVVAMHQLRPASGRRAAAAGRCARPGAVASPTTSSGERIASAGISAFGRRSIARSVALMISPRASARVSTAVGAVSTTVPVNRNGLRRAGGLPGRSNVMSKRPERGSSAALLTARSPVDRCLDCDRLRRAVECDGEIFRLAEPVAAGEHAGDARLDLGGVDRPSGAGDLHLGKAPGVDQVEVMHPDGVEHLLRPAPRRSCRGRASGRSACRRPRPHCRSGRRYARCRSSRSRRA